MAELGNIIFMGTAGFAVPSLELLIRNGYKPAAVITAPDKPAGRGQKLKQSPVKDCALQHGIPVLQPMKLKDENFLEQLQSYNPGLNIVVAFRMLPESVWKMPANGTFNLHASLLPQYRGAAPINHVIINGEKETGVTTFFIDEKIDTGRIIFSEKTNIGDRETAGELHDRLMNLGADLVLKTVKAIESENYSLTDQSQIISQEKELKPAPKIFRDDCHISWDQPAEKVFNFIRGLSPYPAAYCFLKLKDNRKLMLKIFRAVKDIEDQPVDMIPGKFISDGKHFFKIMCIDRFVGIIELQLEGKKRIPISEFLKGFDINQLEDII